ncbi:hypothetical protein G7K_0823-t1 [Saitoella complicata NRRL Y-17804]|uniref:Uncharacterized protein n=1 Tax=Saitoella complicata (strain BCRC 22490 / CBS 7301 / JCM 7358 / NBRC 10748 / NRRL Y-17804) TaxID=698492 RepID=A0A0E9NA70_SAICN|nr:hypothetical protein G7K_0823-t1 [Saitoella complicata NRRL Y-17804]
MTSCGPVNKHLLHHNIAIEPLHLSARKTVCSSLRWPKTDPNLLQDEEVKDVDLSVPGDLGVWASGGVVGNGEDGEGSEVRWLWDDFGLHLCWVGRMDWVQSYYCTLSGSMSIHPLCQPSEKSPF